MKLRGSWEITILAARSGRFPVIAGRLLAEKQRTEVLGSSPAVTAPHLLQRLGQPWASSIVALS